MDEHAFFLSLVIILLTARVFAELAARIKVPTVIGELVAGIILGPSLLGWIEPTEPLQLMAEIGIILLLFEVGLESDVTRLLQTGGKALLVASAGFLLPLLFGYLVASGLFGLPLLVSLFIGGTLTATSIGITVRVLGDLHRQQSREGQVVLGAAVLDDILGVALLAVLYDFSVNGSISMVETAQVLGFVLIFFALAPTAAKLLSLLLQRFYKASEIPGLVPIVVISLMLFLAWLAHAVGSPMLLGGFASGLALSRRFFLPFGLAMKHDPEFVRRVEDRMTPIIEIFKPIFFVMVGVSLNLQEVAWGDSGIWLLSAALFIVAVLGKMLGALVIGENRYTCIAVGMAMTPRGEVGLIFAEMGLVNGILSNDLYAVMVVVIALTTLLPPCAMKWFYGRYYHCGEPVP